MSQPWTESTIETFVDDHYDDLLIESWLPKHPEAWEAYAMTILKPSGRDYCTYEDAPIKVWESFVRWHKSQSRFNKPFVDWIIESLPEPPEQEWEHD